MSANSPSAVPFTDTEKADAATAAVAAEAATGSEAAAASRRRNLPLQRDDEEESGVLMSEEGTTPTAVGEKRPLLEAGIEATAAPEVAMAAENTATASAVGAAPETEAAPPAVTVTTAENTATVAVGASEGAAVPAPDTADVGGVTPAVASVSAAATPAAGDDAAAAAAAKAAARARSGKPPAKRRRTSGYAKTPTASVVHRKNPVKTIAGMFPSFPDMLYELMVFKIREGHCRVPVENAPLGPWVALLRRCYNERKRGHRTSYLNRERIEILNSLNFTWSLLQCSNDRRWETNYRLLLEYKEKNGDCIVPQSTPLGKWVQMQREQHKERLLKDAGHPTKRPVITDERMAKLNAIGFTWRVVGQIAGWDKRYEELVQYKQLHGHCNVPQGWKQNVPLGRWVMKQRVQYHKKRRGQKSQMHDDRIQKLEALGFAWVGPGAHKKKKAELQQQQQQHFGEEQEHHHHHHHTEAPPPPELLPQQHEPYHAQQPPPHFPQQPPPAVPQQPQQQPPQQQQQPPAREIHAPSPFYTQWM